VGYNHRYGISPFPKETRFLVRKLGKELRSARAEVTAETKAKFLKEQLLKFLLF